MLESEIVLSLLIQTLVSKPYEASVSVPVLHHPLSLLAFPLVWRILLAPVGIGGVAVFFGPRGCVNMIQLCVYRGRSDFSLFRWVTPTPIHNDYRIIEYLPRGLRFSARIGGKGSGRETRLANVGFCSEKFGGFAKNLPREGYMFGVLIQMFLQEELRVQIGLKRC